MQDGETASLGRRRLRAKEGLAARMEGGAWGEPAGPFQTRERGASGRRGRQEIKEMRKTVKTRKRESGERRGDGGRKRAGERPRAEKDSHLALWNGLCGKRT